MEARRHTRDPNGCPKSFQVTPRCPKGSPKVPQGVPKDPKKSEKAPQSDTQAQNKINTFSKLGFASRRNVFEPPWLRIGDHPYTFATLEIQIFPKTDENTGNTMLVDPPNKPALAWEREARLNEESLPNMVSTPGHTDTE